MTTKIEWTDKTWNPVTGCTPISLGCKNCYAKIMARRLAGRYGYPEAPRHFDVTLRPDRLDQPLHWKKPRMIFVCSMSDLFHKDVPDDFILRVWQTMFLARHHIFQVLTKRPDRMVHFINGLDKHPGPHYQALPNIWLGVSISTQDELWKVTELLKVPAAVWFVSVEPMLEAIYLDTILHDDNGFPGQLNALSGSWWPAVGDAYEEASNSIEWDALDWVICGAETGPGKRPMNLDWARSLRDQCQAADVSFFFKRDSDGNRELDGRLWEEYPQ